MTTAADSSDPRRQAKWAIWLAALAWVAPLIVIVIVHNVNPASCYEPGGLIALVLAVPAMLLGTAAWDGAAPPRGKLIGWAYGFGVYGALVALVAFGLAAASSVSGAACPIT
jgi:hypothetical protein